MGFYILPPVEVRLEGHWILCTANLPPTLDFIVRDPTDSLLSCFLRQFIHLFSVCTALQILLYLFSATQTSLNARFDEHIQFCNVDLLLKITPPKSKHGVVLRFLSAMVLGVVDQPVAVTADPSLATELEVESLARRYLCHSRVDLLNALRPKFLSIDFETRSTYDREWRD